MIDIRKYFYVAGNKLLRKKLMMEERRWYSLKVFERAEGMWSRFGPRLDRAPDSGERPRRRRRGCGGEIGTGGKASVPV